MSADDLETCSVCLDALSSGTCSFLVSDQIQSVTIRACPHFIHTACAVKLRPRKCPLCRAHFSRLSAPLDQKWLSSMTSEELVRGLRRLDGLRGVARLPAAMFS
ncbi:UPF1 [Symbiodinium natans]|uniref:UPF1 protein n=1 Tax=Symbiodinium natans TaxID=878477 RepID=A0A812P1U1_9DINO|nr:UPF1 [Symbiodinium natans]